MNTINNPLILKNYPEIGDESMYVPANTSPGEYVDKALAEEMLKGFEKLYNTIDSCVELTPELLQELRKLILKAKGE